MNFEVQVYNQNKPHAYSNAMSVGTHQYYIIK